MNTDLTSQQREAQIEFASFARHSLAPFVDDMDRIESTPVHLLHEIARQGYLGAVAPRQFGGAGMDMSTLGLLHEEFGRVCSSLRSLLTVQSMLIYALMRRGSKEQKTRWLPSLASGEMVGAFGLTEPLVGSDARHIQTRFLQDGDTFILNGQKKWLTYGQIADLFLIFAQKEGHISAFLVEKDTPGLTILPLKGLLGTRASMLVELHLQDCRIPRISLLGSLGFAFETVMGLCLSLGRYSVACGCVGIVQACLDASLLYVDQRVQFNVLLIEHQLIQQMITNMATNLVTARLLCHETGRLMDRASPDGILSTWMAKYVASLAAQNAAHDAVQIHGANGCSNNYPVERYLRDATVMEIIEGSTQIQQTTIARYYTNMQMQTAKDC